MNVWQATNPKARDFRLEAIGPAYKKSRLDPVEDEGGDGEAASSADAAPDASEGGAPSTD